VRRQAGFITLAVRIVAGLVALAAGLSPLPAMAGERSERIGGVDVVVWRPDAASAERLPVVLFSHGLYTCATQSRYLMEAIAAAGYVVVAPNHRDATCSMTMGWGLSRIPGKPSMLWTDDDYRDRADDVRAVVAAMRADARFRDADTDRLALVGHSLGGYTVLGLAGGWPSWTLAGVKAVLALAPYSLPFRSSEGLRRLRAPVMYQAATYDWIFTPPLRGEGGAYDVSPQPKYYVEIDAWHLAWADVGAVRKERIIEYAVAFLDHFVKDAPEASLLRATAMRVAGAARLR
jgi:predicted dienelactone hydrolase